MKWRYYEEFGYWGQIGTLFVVYLGLTLLQDVLRTDHEEFRQFQYFLFLIDALTVSVYRGFLCATCLHCTTGPTLDLVFSL